MSVQPRQPTVREVVSAPIDIAAGIVTEVVSTTASIVLAPARAVALVGSTIGRLGRTLDHLDDMADGVTAMEREMRGMRADLAEVIGELEGIRDLNTRLHVIGDSVVDMNTGVSAMSANVEALNGSIDNIDALAAKFARFGGRRKTA
jgi:methyl-accepting chemotaxis protein